MFIFAAKKNNQLKRIYTTNRKLVYRMLPMESGNLTFTESDTIPAWNPQYHTYTLDTKTNKKKAGMNIDEIMDVTQYACFSSSHQIILQTINMRIRCNILTTLTRICFF